MIRKVFLTLGAVLVLTLLCSTGRAPGVKVRANVSYSAQRNPNIFCDKSNNLYLVGAVATLPASAHSPGSQIFFTRSTDDGNTWDNVPLTRMLTHSYISGIGALDPQIAITTTGNPFRSYVIYDDDTGGPRQVFFIRTKKKIKFQQPFNLIHQGEGGFQPKLALDTAGNIYVTWGDTLNDGKQIVFERSTDLGLTFSQLTNISQSKGEAFYPSIATDKSGGIDLVWQDNASGVNTIMFARSTDSGDTFSSPMAVSDGAGDASLAQVGVDNAGGLNVAWCQQVAGAVQVLISRSEDLGATFSTPLQITSAVNMVADQPAMTFSKDTTYIAYQDDHSGQVYLTSSLSSNLNFSSPVRFSAADTSKGEAHSPSITVDRNGKLHLVFIDSSILGNEEGLVVYTTTTDGHTFSKPTLILTFINT